METATILKRINGAMAGYDNLPWDLKRELDALVKDLEADIRAATAKSKGAGDAFKTIEKMLTTGDKYRPALCGAWVDENGLQCSVDGFRAYRLKDHLPLTPLADKVEPIRLHEVFKNPMERENTTMERPNPKDVKAHIAIEKAKGTRSILWDFGPGLPAVNAQYLLDMLTVFPDAVFHIPVEGTKNRMIQCLYVTSAKGDGLILPVRVEKKEQEAKDLDRDTGAGHAGETRDTGAGHSDERE